MPVDGVDQDELLGQCVHGPDATAGDSAVALGHLVMNVAGAELRLEGHCVFCLVQPEFDSALAFVEPFMENSAHLKSFRDQGVLDCCYFLNTPNHRRISSFFNFSQEKNAKASLVQGLAPNGINACSHKVWDI